MSTSPLRFLSPAPVMMVAMVVRLTTLSNGCTPMRHLMKLAPSTELVDTIMAPNAPSKSSVRTAPHPKAAGTKTTTRSITPMSLVRSVVSKP